MKLTAPGRTAGSYKRENLKNDRILYGFFHHKQLKILLANPSGRATRVCDALAQELLERQRISRQTYDAYLRQLQAAFPDFEAVRAWDGRWAEQLYAFAHSIRKRVFGTDVLDWLNLLHAGQPLAFDPTGGIDQRKKKESLLQTADHVLLALFDTSYFSLLVQDLEAIPHKNIWLLVSKEPGNELPTRAVMEHLLQGRKQVRYLEDDGEDTLLPGENTCLLAYGEDGLLYCRDLQLDSIVTAAPVGYYAQALVGQLGLVRPCVVYVPRGLDITGCVPLTE